MVTIMCEREVTVVVCVKEVSERGSAMGGLLKCPKFICIGDTFGGCWFLLMSMMVSPQKYGQLII